MTAKRNQRVSRRGFMGTAAGGIAAVAGCVTKAPDPTRPPNVVFLFSDEHRYQSMGISEMPELHTPNMARMAADGVEFTHCISNYPVCSPYRAILMSGQWPCQQGVTDNNIPLAADENSLGAVFKRAGYRTGYVGKWHLGGLRAEPFGFDTSLIWSATNTHYNKSKYHPADAPPVQPEGYNATLMTDQALAFMDDHRDAPFFIMVSWNPPHARFTDAPPDKKALYDEGSLSRRPNVDLKPSQEAKGNARIWHKNDWPNYQGYHAHVSAIDEEIGRVVAHLERLGIADNTIVVYTSDHGSMLGSHGIGSKRQPFEESIRVPFLVRWPNGLPKGRKRDALFGAIDIMPTLCGLASLPAPTTCAGQDFAPLLRGERFTPPTSQLLMHISKLNASGGNSHPAPIFRGVRTQRHTYACLAGGTTYLFDNERDPYQLDNLAGKPDHKDLQTDLHAELLRLLHEAKDPFFSAR
ncbi:MAG: sulfatase [bacterium]|nr:sulfatase [bacterium]